MLEDIMRRNFGWALASFALLSGVGSAMAADMAVKARPMPVPVVAVYNWTGWYVGGNVGYGRGGGNVDLAPTNNPTSIGYFGGTFPAFIPAHERLNPSGVIGGGQVGYNWQWDRLVAGIEADIQGADGRGTVNTLVAPITSLTTQRLDWFGTVRGRIGLAANSVLFYATGGLAYGQVNHVFSTNNDGGGAFENIASRDTRAGYAVGAGVEWGFAPQWTVKAEYLFLDFGSPTFATIGTGTTPPGASIDAHFQDRFHIARVGVNYRFGAPVVAKY
jgi:outer membrane immunogenic protein